MEMQKMKSVNSKVYTFYPFLFAFYPVLTLLALNIDQINPDTLVRPLIFSAVFSAGVWLVLSLLLRNPWKSGLITLVIEVLFFSFGHVLRLIKGIPAIGPALGNDVFMALVDLVLLAVFTFWIIRTKSRLYYVSVFLTFTNVILLIMPLFQITYHYWGDQKNNPVNNSQSITAQVQIDKPDIYFIILDAYSREDLLKTAFGFDNQPFVDQLSALGFDVIPCSRSNYNATALSLSSMLNLNYETTIGVDAASVSSGEATMVPWIKNNIVRNTMEDIGYNIYTFDNEFPGLDWPGSNKFTLPKQEASISKQLLPPESIFIKDSALNILLDSQVGIFKELQTTVDSPYSNHIELVKNILDKLPGTATLAGPKFVYAHLILPHKPFVFDSQGNIRTDSHYFKDGNPFTDDFYREGYIGQVEFANSQMVQILKDILHYSQKPPMGTNRPIQPLKT